LCCRLKYLSVLFANKMSKNLIEQFASSYPRTRPASGKEFDNFSGNMPPRQAVSDFSKPQSHVPNQIRTKLSEVMEPFQPPYQQPKTLKLGTDKGGNSARKFLTVLLIVFLAAFLYSVFAYTISDTILSKFGLLLFSEEGSPTFTIIVIHSIILLSLVYLILSTINYC